MTNLELIYRELATTYELPVATVEAICRVQFRLARETMEGDTFATIRWPYIGSLQPIEGRLKRYKDSTWWDKEAGKTIKKA